MRALTSFKSMRNHIMHSLFFLILSCFASQLTAIEWENTNTLFLTHIIYRHGDRTPDSNLKVPNNPYANETFFPYGRGQLTLEGKKRAYNLGVKLRKRYSQFLGPVYHMDLIEAISSSAARCVMSAQSVLTALFPPNWKSQVKFGFDWQPVYYKAPSANEDQLIIPTCPLIWEVDLEMDQETASFYDYVSLNVGTKLRKPFDLFSIQNTYQVLEELGYALPDWVSRVWPEPFRRHGLKIWKLIADQNVPYAIGNLLKKINEDTLNVINGVGVKERKMFMYSAHDLNVVAYLGAIGVYRENYYVNYSACIMIEIHIIDGIYAVKVFFDNADGNKPQILKIPACGNREYCPLQTYIEITSEYYGPENFCT